MNLINWQNYIAFDCAGQQVVWFEFDVQRHQKPKTKRRGQTPKRFVMNQSSFSVRYAYNLPVYKSLECSLQPLKIF
jgi:hypothetical protein